MSSVREKREEEDALLRRAANAATDATNLATNANRFKSGNDYFEEEEEEMDVAAMMGFSGGFGSKKKKHNREQQQEEQRGKGGEGRREEEMERKQQNDDEDDASVIGRRMQKSKKEDKEEALNTNEADEDDDLEYCHYLQKELGGNVGSLVDNKHLMRHVSVGPTTPKAAVTDFKLLTIRHERQW